MDPGSDMPSYRWIRQGWRGREWRLVGPAGVAATLRWRGWSRTFEVDLQGASWRVRPEGFWGRRFVVSDARGFERLAVRPGWSGWDVEGHAWGTLRWRRTSWWRGSFQLEAPGRGIVARLTPRWTQGQAAVQADLPEGLLLAALGWAFILMAQASSATA
jgi:hypothetical protein